MEKEGLYLCEKCGENVPEGGDDDLSSHLCAKDLMMTSVHNNVNKGQLGKVTSYQCPLCSEAFLMPGALKRHFPTHRRDEPEGPLRCPEQGCLFSHPDPRAYRDHLSSQHALTPVPCTFRSCGLPFRSQAEMQVHRRNHVPFHCPRCDFATAHAKMLSVHRLEHDCPPAAPEGSRKVTDRVTDRLCGGADRVTDRLCGGADTSSGRPKRARKRNPAYMTSSQEEEEEEEEEEHRSKRAKEEMKKDKSSVATNINGHHHSKGHVLEDTELMYRTHMCPECRRCFKMRSHLQEHLHLHFPDPSLQCPTCQHHFTSKSKLRVHMLREAGQKGHRCHLCDYAAVERNSLRRHLASVHAEEVAVATAGAGGGEGVHALDAMLDLYPCPSCGESFRQSRALKAHMKSRHTSRDGQPLACFQEGCAFQSCDRKELLRHAADSHQVKAVECCHHACSALFRNLVDMEAHHRTHMAFHCSLCDFCSSNKSLFQQHKRQGHAGDDELSCDFCPFTTFNLVEFQQHVSHFHASEKIHRCPQCNFVTAHKRVLGRHILMHSGEKPHKCNQCEFRCRDETYLSKHMLTHSDDKNHMCSECGYVTKWKHYLNVHMRKHAGDLRYQCDQCSYRCHRIDQLNSHKLRHQAKSLICEVCAYSCKRKYELRKHMLLKHSQGEGHQPPIFQCKYCTYQTSYRQALHNHENCKHTRTREFRCALCPYSTYSSTGLFLHKRKAHGYVPGDTLWLEKYAKKESENNSVDLLQGFYTVASQDGAKNSAEVPVETEREKYAVVAGSLVQNGNNQKNVPPVSETTEIADSNAGVVAQEMVISASNYSTNNPEQRCLTLPLTTIAKTECTGKTSLLSETTEVCGDLTHSSTLDDPKTPQRDSPREMSAITSASEVEEDDALDDQPDPGDTSDGEAPLVSTSQQVRAAENEPHTTEPAEAAASVSGSLTEPSAPATESEIRLKAMRKRDKDQAEALVLEGRVQMLVVRKEANGAAVYRCDHCSYVTRKQTSLQRHCHSVCRARWRDLKCKACGAQFKQKRGLDTHCLGKCPALRLKTRRFVRMPSTGQEATEGESIQSGDGLERPNEATSTDQSDTRPCVNETTRGSVAAESEPRGGEENVRILTNPRGSFEKGSNASRRKRKGKKIGKAKRRVKRASEKTEKVNPGNSQKDNAQSYTKDNEKFMCRICSFSSCRLATIERHCSMCTNKPPAASPQRPDDCDEELEEEREKENSDRTGDSGEDVLTVSKLGHKFSCPSCPFMCNQQRALETHEKRGCLKANELQCQLCSFVAMSKKALANHVLVHQKNKQTPLKLGKKVVLRCKKCPFVCKQERCMAQHVALKHDGARPHRCRFCAFGTTRRYRLEAHESLHTGVGRHSCETCNRTFGTTSKLRQHRERVHDQDKQPCHFCSLCDFSSYALNDVRRHTLSCHTGELRHTCGKCEAPFSSDAALKQHCNRRHPSQDSLLACPKCDFTCRSQASLRGHQRSEHPRLECTTCQEVFHTRESLEVHRRTHLAQRCQLCPFATRKRQLLVQHVLDKHEDGPAEDKPLKCAICEFVCRHQLVFEQHARSHGGTRLYKCTDCQFSTRNKQKITWHIRIHTGEKPYRCEQCSYTCADPSRLKYHMRIHQEEKKYLCPECGYKCKWMSQLKYHMTKHTGDKPYSCEECEYRTNRRDALRVHQETRHCDVRSFICEKCGKAFKTRFLLKTHQRKHSEDRPYACGQCSKAFRWPAGLRHHYLSHTGLQPFLCCRCPYRAKQRFQVVKHLRRHHPGQPVEGGVVRDPSALSLTLQEARVGSLGGGEEARDGAEGEEESLVQEVREAITEEG